MRAVVYTAIFGGYDALKQPPPQDEPCDFICYTDGEMPSRVGAWRIIHVKTDHKLHPRLQAKRFKILSHRIFPRVPYLPFLFRRRFDMSIWIDASLQTHQFDVRQGHARQARRWRLGNVRPSRQGLHLRGGHGQHHHAQVSTTCRSSLRSKPTGRSCLRTADSTPAPSLSGESRRRNGSREFTCSGGKKTPNGPIRINSPCRSSFARSADAIRS